MLPFLKNKQASVAGLIMKTRDPDEKQDVEGPDEASAAIESCAQELIRAVHARDVKAVADALEDAFSILDSMPHVEGEHVEPHSYDAQNQKAAKQE